MHAVRAGAGRRPVSGGRQSGRPRPPLVRQPVHVSGYPRLTRQHGRDVFALTPLWFRMGSA